MSFKGLRIIARLIFEDKARSHRDVNYLAGFQDESFDVVTMTDVFEHAGKNI